MKKTVTQYLCIERFQTPCFCCADLRIASVVRKKRVLMCEADLVYSFPVERVLVEFESESIAEAFQQALANKRACINIEEDEEGDEDGKVRENSGITRIAIMHDDGISAYGFQGLEAPLRRWMRANGFPSDDCLLWSV